MKRTGLEKIWRIAKAKWLHKSRERQSRRCKQEKKRHEKYSNAFYRHPWRLTYGDDIEVVVTQVADELDCIDELVLNNELELYRLVGYPIRVAPQDKEKEFVRPLWAIEVFQNGRLARQITYYLQPRFPDKSPCDAVDTESPSPLKTER